MPATFGSELTYCNYHACARQFCLTSPATPQLHQTFLLRHTATPRRYRIVATMSSTASAGAVAANQPEESSVEASNSALVVYDHSATTLTASDALADVTKASEKIRDNTNEIIDLVQSALHNVGLYTEEETEGMLGLIREQFNELFTLSEEVRKHTDTTHGEVRKRYSTEIQRVKQHHIGEHKTFTAWT